MGKAKGMIVAVKFFSNAKHYYFYYNGVEELNVGDQVLCYTSYAFQVGLVVGVNMPKPQFKVTASIVLVFKDDMLDTFTNNHLDNMEQMKKEQHVLNVLKNI